MMTRCLCQGTTNHVSPLTCTLSVKSTFFSLYADIDLVLLVPEVTGSAWPVKNKFFESSSLLEYFVNLKLHTHRIK